MPTLFGPNMKKAYTTVATSRKFWEAEKVRAGKGVNTKVFMLNYGPAIDHAVKVATSVVNDCTRRGGVAKADLDKLATEFKKVSTISAKYHKICDEKRRSDAANAQAWEVLGKATSDIDRRFAAVLDGLAKASGHETGTNLRNAVQASRQARGRT